MENEMDGKISLDKSVEKPVMVNLWDGSPFEEPEKKEVEPITERCVLEAELQEKQRAFDREVKRARPGTPGNRISEAIEKEYGDIDDGFFTFFFKTADLEDRAFRMVKIQMGIWRTQLEILKRLENM